MTMVVQISTMNKDKQINKNKAQLEDIILTVGTYS